MIPNNSDLIWGGRNSVIYLATGTFSCTGSLNILVCFDNASTLWGWFNSCISNKGNFIFTFWNYLYSFKIQGGFNKSATLTNCKNSVPGISRYLDTSKLWIV